MRWIQIGDHAHAVMRNNKGLTLCRLEIARAKSIVVSPPFEERCGNCDKEWRKRGRMTAKPKMPKTAEQRAVYEPQHTFDDFDREGA
jgi:hypothetical protein